MRRQLLGAVRRGPENARDALPLQDFEHGFVQVGVARDGFSPARAALATREVASAPTGFFHDQEPGRDVPGVEFEFPEAVEASGCDITEIEGGAAVAPNRLGGFRESRKVVEVVIGRVMNVVRKAGGEHRVIELGFLAHP